MFCFLLFYYSLYFSIVLFTTSLVFSSFVLFCFATSVCLLLSVSVCVCIFLFWSRFALSCSLFFHLLHKTYHRFLFAHALSLAFVLALSSIALVCFALALERGRATAKLVCLFVCVLSSFRPTLALSPSISCFRLFASISPLLLYCLSLLSF